MIPVAKGAAAWAILILFLFAGAYLFAGEDVERAAQLEQIYLRKVSLLQRLETLPKREAAIRRKLADLGNEEAEQYLYSGDHRSAQVLIQRDLRTLADGVGLAFGSMRPLSRGHQSADIIPAVVQVTFSTNHETLIKLLERIDAAQPMLKVKKLSISKQRESSETQAAVLKAVLEVSGYQNAVQGVGR